MITVITGASSGMGKALAVKAIAAGHIVVVNARRKELLEDLKVRAPERVHIVLGDITKSETQQMLLEQIRIHGKIDYLINNAGFGHFGPLEAQDNISEMIELNITTLIKVTKMCLPFLKKSRNGRILNIASALGQMELPFMTTYVATKYAVVGFTKSLNLELAGSSVSASAYCPTGVQTEFGQRAMGQARGQTTDKFSEPVSRVVSGIWNKRNSRWSVVYPTLISFFSVAFFNLFKPIVIPTINTLVRWKGESILD